MIIHALLVFLETIFFNIAGFAPVGNDANFAFRHFIKKFLCLTVEFDSFDTDFRRP